MLWIIQKDFFTENKQNALNRLNIPFILVDVYKNKIEPEIPIDNTMPIITNGSIMLSNIANIRNWKPGSFFNENFSYKSWAKHYNDFLLNKNAQISMLKDTVVHFDNFFARPILDNKTFNGKIFTKDEFLIFQKNSLNLKPGVANPNTEILVSPIKNIGQEHRHYIVDGEIITSSRYKLAGQPNFKEGADDNILDVVNTAIKIWQPARAFVLDTYISGDEIGIVEIGCICHAGLYESDTIKLFNALDSMNIYNETKKEKKWKP